MAVGKNKRNSQTLLAPVNEKIPVTRAKSRIIVELGKLHEAGVCQVHLEISVLVHQILKILPVLAHLKVHSHRPPAQPVPQQAEVPTLLLHTVKNLRQHSLASPKRRRNLSEDL